MGCRVVAVEPNLEMRQTSDRLFSGIERYRSVDGCAESMPLDSASVDLITAAQAFHWFEIDQARAEFLRVLTSRGQVALIWNDRVADDPLHVALDELFGEYRGPQRAATIAREERSRLPSFFGASQPKEYSWPHGHFLSEEGLLSLVFSRSYTPAPESTKGHELADRVRQVFGRFQCDGKVDVRYQTVAFLGRPS
jgi:SAM-dependent methyltransferase